MTSTASGTRTARSAGSGRAATGCSPRTGPSASSRGGTWTLPPEQAEERLRESEQRWRSLTEALPQLVWSATPDGACEYFSTQWTRARRGPRE